MNRKLKGYRNMAGLTQQDMADVIGVNRPYYSLKENGKVAFSSEQERAIFNVLKTKIHNLKMEDVFPIP